MIEVGSIIDDRYEIQALLGQGGLAEVYRVRHTALGSLHALKVLTWDRKALDRRLLLEGRIQAQLRHPNIVAVTDVLRVDGRASLLMEFVDGPALDAWLEDHGPLGIEPALDLFAPMLAGVVCAHDAGVLHRDLKPQNVLLDRQGNELIPKVADFGLAKVMVEEMVAGATRAGATMGTPGYMAPEQLRDAASADARSDVFALGAILHEMITGRPAFADEEGFIAVTATLERTAAPLEGVPEHVAAAVACAVSARPQDRYADARAFADALLPEGDKRRARTLAVATQPVSLSDPGEGRGNETWRSSASIPAPSSRETYSDAGEAAPASDPPAAMALAPAHAPAASSGRSVVPLVVGAVLLLTLLPLALVVLGGGVAWLSVRSGSTALPIEPEPTISAAPAPATEPVPIETADVDEPPAPDATDGVVEASALSPGEAVPRPEPAPAFEGSPEPAEVSGTEAVPAPEAAPEPIVAPEPAGTEAAEEPDPAVAEAARQAMTEQMTRELVGTWKGQAQGRPFQLRVLSATPELVRAEVVFNPGPAQQIIPVSGQYLDGALTMSDGTLDVAATCSGSKLTGTYARGKRPVAFETSR